MTSLLLTSLLGASVTWLGPAPRAPTELKRVVTIAPSLTETVVALGAGDRLVGVSRFDELPQVEKVARVGGFSDPSLETIVALKPDLVVVQKGPGNQRPVETLASLGISVMAVPLTTIADVSDAIQELGRVLGRERIAAELVTLLEATRGHLRARSKSRTAHPTVLFVYGFSPLVVAGPGSFADELLQDCGARNAAQAAPTPYPTYSLERAVKLAPDVVIDAADVASGREEVRALGSLRHARWRSVPTRALLHPGPGLALALLQLEALLYGAAD